MNAFSPCKSLRILSEGLNYSSMHYKSLLLTNLENQQKYDIIGDI